MTYILFAALLVLGFVLSTVARWKDSMRQPLIVLYAIIALTYLSWRILYTIPTQGVWNIAFGVTFVALEIIMVIQTLTFGTLFWKPAALRKGAELDFDDVPTVDVFIATYNEPADILETSIVAAVQLNYPIDKFKVHLLDDGDRPEMRKLADKWGIGYIRRDGHEGAKAGNLNNAMAHTHGEFVVTMDADMILKPQFLQHMVGHFRDSNVGFVQSPQAFHNADVFQHNLFAEDIVRNDQDFFMRFIEPQRDMYNAAIYVGSGAIFRRSAIESIGGFVTDVITEDMATGLVLQDSGWKSVYVNEVLATGLSAETYGELLKQRIRWGRGNIQVLKKYAFGRLKNLTFMQRWLLFDSVHYWFFGVYRLAFILLPILVLATGVQLINANLVTFFILWSLQFMYSRFVYDAITKGRFKTVWTSVYELAQAPQLTLAILTEFIFGNTIGFQVTSKGSETRRARFAWEHAWQQLVIFAVSLVAIGYAIGEISLRGPEYGLTMAIPLFWMIYNTICLIGALAVAIDQPRKKHRLCSYQVPGTCILEGESSAHMQVQIEALHVEKVCFSIPESLLNKFELTSRAVVSFDNFAPIPVLIDEADIVHGRVFIFAKYDDISSQNYARLVALLNHINTIRFQKRPSSHRVGIWDVTIGLMLRRLFYRDPVLGSKHPKVVQVLSV